MRTRSKKLGKIYVNVLDCGDGIPVGSEIFCIHPYRFWGSPSLLCSKHESLSRG
jgi:hypothetical protein